MKIVILNKPYDVLSQFRPDEKHQTMADFIDDKDLRLAGRLDMDSEGLVFLTDHGGLNQYITNPANKKFKTYMVQVDGDVTEEALEQLRRRDRHRPHPARQAEEEHAGHRHRP